MMTIRKIQPTDSPAMATIIRTVMPEFGANRPGFALFDKAVDNIHAAYDRPQSIYFVCEQGGKIVGGGGIAPLEDGGTGVCELQKMYFLPEGRGKGSGQKILSECLQAARALGFTFCYLETFNTMTGAMKLYERNGFKKLPGPLGNTGHFACDTFYGIELK